MPVRKKPICYITLVMKIFLISIGIITIQNKNLQLVVISAAILGYIPMFYETIKIMTNSSSNVSMISDSICMLLIFFSPFCLHFITLLHKRVFIRTMELINEENDVRFIELLNKRFLRLLLLVISVAIVCELPYIICTIIMGFVSDVKLGSPESLIFPCYFPWHYDTSINYLLAIFCEILLLIHPIVVEYGTVLTLGSFYLYIDSKFNELLTSLQNMKDMKNEVFLHNCNEIKTLRNVDSINSDLIQIMIDYQNWKRTSKELVSFTADFSSVILLSAMICSVLNIASLADEAVSTPVLKIKNFSILTYIFAHLFLVCFLGEYLHNADDTFRDAIYSISWYTKSRKLRKTAMMIMMQTQAPMTVKAYGMISVDKRLTLRMLRNIYSMLNLYRNTYKH